jgi:N-acetyl-gamma-glutamyl-phosphate/LysW-gamma-L-alpha-aminoadipyl-6-phosphate reductase
LPLVRAGIITGNDVVISDVKVGSSEGGAQGNDGSHHPERSGVVRSFAPTGHRHTAEIVQATGLSNVHLSITSVELVRGAVATVHCLPSHVVDEKTLWRAYRACYRDEPFVRIVRERTGFHRLPEPKLLGGTNLADVGFDLDAQSGRIVSICAIDNLMKGAAGSAVQCLNLMCDYPETTALEMIGLHPY